MWSWLSLNQIASFAGAYFFCQMMFATKFARPNSSSMTTFA